MKKYNYLRLFTLIFVFFVTAIIYPSLPSRIPTHWNINGAVDGYSSKNFGAYLMPGLLALLLIGFKYIPSFDPKREKYKLFKKEWEIIQTILVSFFAFMQFLILYSALFAGIDISKLMVIGFGLFFVTLGNYLGKVRQNFFLGIRTPWTLSSEDNWNKTHRFGGWGFVIGGVILVFGAIMDVSPSLLFAVLVISALLPVFYSLYLFKKKN